VVPVTPHDGVLLLVAGVSIRYPGYHERSYDIPRALFLRHFTGRWIEMLMEIFIP